MHQAIHAAAAMPNRHLERIQARSVPSDREACQPTMKRLKASMTKAT